MNHYTAGVTGQRNPCEARYFKEAPLAWRVGFVALLMMLCCRSLHDVKSVAAAETPTRPNVVLIITDDQGIGDLGCHGNPILKTPQLDRLYEQSVRLTNFHVNSFCTPTRAALMSGRYSIRSGCTGTINGLSLMRRDEVTLAERFSAAGYATGMFGKWHLGDNYPYRPEDRGFQEVMRHGGGGVGQTPDIWGNDYFDDVYVYNGRGQRCAGYCTDVFFNEALNFIRQKRERPFFVYLSTNAPHAPFNVPDRFSRPYRDQGLGVEAANFYGMIANIDANVGRLRERLKAWGLEDNTLLVFMTDNGSRAPVPPAERAAWFNAGYRGTKGSLHEGGHRVPCFLHWPQGGLVGGRDENRLAMHVDLTPTLSTWCGLPDAPGRPLDGADLSAMLRGSGQWPDRTMFVCQNSPQQFSVMTQRWRLVGFGGRRPRLELYEIETDKGQAHDLAARHSDVVQHLKTAIDAWYADVNARNTSDIPIVLGNPAENPVRLTAHDWHPDEGDVRATPWDHDRIRQAPWVNGYWAVQVERAGMYEFELRQQPAAAKFPIEAVTARLKIADIDRQQTIPVSWVRDSNGDYVNATSVVRFTVPLPQGVTRLRTWFATAEGRSRGAFYVSVRYIERNDDKCVK